MKIGDIIKIKIDRPLGSCHPKYKNMIYPVNYGYVEGVIAPDDEGQDVYLLGVDYPVNEFTARIIAIIKRSDDVEEKMGCLSWKYDFYKKRNMGAGSVLGEIFQFQNNHVIFTLTAKNYSSRKVGNG